jgi:putative adhesin
MSTNKAVSALLACLVATAAGAQQTAPGSECEGRWGGWRNAAHACEVREVTARASGTLTVDADPNGGISVTGADRRDVSVRATVHAWGADDAAARAMLAEIVVHTDDRIRATGPQQQGRAGWSVSYEIVAPRDSNLDLETLNGGISITNLRGDVEFDTTNGGINLDGLAGNVRGSTTNGGVEVTLTGERWDGDALTVRTTNGGIRLRVPEDYSARLETRTVNGRTNIDFPVTVQGQLGRELNTTLGAGGALVRAETTNGGVRVSRY